MVVALSLAGIHLQKVLEADPCNKPEMAVGSSAAHAQTKVLPCCSSSAYQCGKWSCWSCNLLTSSALSSVSGVKCQVEP